ncbi:hypothetical protein M5K25_002978 [Dendrobium thyrsiflorum]|uniref:Protein FAR1-RELATED SEQUENCE n=1 Tax=Dendrobium thyrsiflorum TaxID=117978 RepID=A0ABD0VQ08_DENTH
MKCSEEISPNIEIEERMKCSEEINIEDRGNDIQKSEVRFTGTSEGFNTSVAYKDEKEAYEAYCSYAHNNGFSVRKDHHSFWPNSRKIKTKDFVCSKAGFKKQSDLNSQKKCRRSETRTGCPCLIRFSVDEDGNWICDSEVEFERSWNEMILEGNLQTHEWLGDLYKIRSKWSTAFNKEYFSMGILSTQRSESTNNVCHGISKPTSSITECFLGLEKIITNWRRNEQDEDHKCSQSEIVPVIRSSSILKQAARFYSRKLYSFFEEEFLQGVGGMSIDFVSNDSSKFLVNHTENKDQSNPWVVHFDASDCTIQCTCKKFETMGLLCCHSMRVLRQLDIVKIPEKYLMMRWSAKARKSFYSGYGCLGKGSDSGSGFIFRNHISRFAYQISTRAQGNELAEQYMLGAMKDMAENIDLLVDGKMTNSNLISKSKSRAAPVSAFKDPQKRRPKGISNARLKGYWEKKKQKSTFYLRFNCVLTAL